MKVLLIRPPRIKQAVALGELMYSEPIGLEMVYAMLEASHQVEILDLMAEKIAIEAKLTEFEPQVVGITTLCIDVPMVKVLAEAVKKYDAGIVTLVGGTQAFVNSKAFFINAVDHVMKYTTSRNMIELFAYLAKGEKPPIIDGVCSRVNYFKTSMAAMNMSIPTGLPQPNIEGTIPTLATSRVLLWAQLKDVRKCADSACDGGLKDQQKSILAWIL